MNIIVLTGSPHKRGTSALLADEFIRGAKKSGHNVFRFDAAFENVNPCIACDYCRKKEGKCTHTDAMEELYPKLIETDLIAFVTPLYYFGMTTQLKRVIDRFYAADNTLRNMQKRTILIATGADSEVWAMDALIKHYHAINRYLGWKDVGNVLALGVSTRKDIEHTLFPQQAYKLGLSLS